MTEAEIAAALTEFDAVWLTLWAEARGEPIEGQIAVGNVIRNRVQADLAGDDQPDWWGEGWKAVCLKPQQFSCWTRGADENHRLLIEKASLVVSDYAERSTQRSDPIIRQIKYVTEGLLNGALLDNTGGAVQYLTRQLYHANPPRWAQGPHLRVHTFGSQVFLA